MSHHRKTEIAHDAIVRSIDSNSVTVLLLNNEGCSGCHAEKACGVSGKESKTIIIEGKYNVKPGNRVTVTMKLSDGYRALFLGYLLPLAIFLVCLVFLSAFSVNELLSGLISLGALVPYYLIFFLFRKLIYTGISFNIKM
jgi:sigma-E factor negative regulatory protein RseC